MSRNRILLVTLACIFSFQTIQAQEKKKDDPVVDEIIAVVGDQIILKSEVERQLLEFDLPDSMTKNMARCEIFINSLYQKLLVNQAYIDSLELSDGEVEGEINRRLNYFIAQIGSKEALEEYYKKTISEIKDEMRKPIKEMLLAQRMRQKIVGKYKISPTEVKEFFNTIPKDSLPYYNTELEISQIVVFPKPTEAEKEKALKKIKELRQRIMKGDKFETMAILYSEDNGTATKGGDLGMRSKSDFVTEFAATAMKLQKDSISQVVETKFGYHILKLVDRKGERVHVKHILIKPKFTSDARTETIAKLNEIRSEIVDDTLTFEDAAFLHSEDEMTKNSGGAISDPETGSTKIPVDQMDATLFFVIDTMKVGAISEPVSMTYQDGRKAYRLVYLKSRTPPHKANLKDDYPKIKDLAQSFKETEILQDWIEEAYNNTYITIKKPYAECETVKERETIKNASKNTKK